MRKGLPSAVALSSLLACVYINEQHIYQLTSQTYRCRTGTKTLNEALSILLKGPVHDAGVQSLGGSSHEIQQWLRIMKAVPTAKTFGEKKYVEYLLADILDGYVATVDCPAAVLAPELMSLYPEAVVIVSTRDQASWWKSMSNMNSMMSNWYLPWMVLWLPKIGVYGRWRTLFRRMLKSRYGNSRIREGTLRQHEDFLRSIVPANKLYFYDVADGWGPLCKILDLPVPDRSFPHNNSTGDAGKLWRDVITLGIISWIVVLTFAWFFIKFFWGRLPAATELTGILGSSAYGRGVAYSNTSQN